MRTREEFDQAFPTQITLPVQWGDMDAFGHVNNVMYFRYFESVRLAYFESLELMSHKHLAPILAETQCKFRRPLFYPDQITVGTAVTEIHEYGFMMQYGIFSKQQQTAASLGSGRIVLIDKATGAKGVVDDVMKQRIEDLAKK
ncbi:acyl-CoA thioesterase [Marinicella rhabdoformis]|uniref:acyl-CoA thioesterase n=1 Tax=Marinicella rhabdoformis TaxID=2580566 RepID=UPI0012AEC8DB|nr:acyl-CoA thioesterase [Marinicella rhabdoformis]